MLEVKYEKDSNRVQNEESGTTVPHSDNDEKKDLKRKSITFGQDVTNVRFSSDSSHLLLHRVQR